jgi:hypothetical protein
MDIGVATGKYGLSDSVVRAMVQVESGGNQWAYNPEPHYRWLWDMRRNRPFRALLPGESDAEKPPLDFGCLAGDPDQEWWAQQASWGLMQTMGAVAREVGFTGPYLTELCDPRTSLEYGCKFLRRLLDRHGHNIDFALAAYNTGSPDHFPGSAADVYVGKIHAQMGA